MTAMSDLQFLLAVRARIESPDHWSRNSYFRDAKGAPIWDESQYPNATQWSLGGAAQVVMDFESGATARLARLLGFSGPVAMNDAQDWPMTRHQNVLTRIDQAIGHLRAEGQS